MEFKQADQDPTTTQMLRNSKTTGHDMDALAKVPGCQHPAHCHIQCVTVCITLRPSEALCLELPEYACLALSGSDLYLFKMTRQSSVKHFCKFPEPLWLIIKATSRGLQMCALQPRGMN